MVNMGVSNLVFYRVRKVGNKYYLYKEWYDPETKKRRSKSLGNCEWIEKIIEEYRNSRHVAGPRGFEPRTSGIRRPALIGISPAS